MDILTAEEMRNADRAAIAAGIPSLVLMENSAWAVLRALEQKFAALAKERITIFCGKGNNGGDGMAVGRLLALHHRPKSLTIFLAYSPEELRGDAAHQFAMLQALEIPWTNHLPGDVGITTLALDAFLGTGLSGDLKEPIASLVETFNRLPRARKISIDTPTGLKTKVELTISLAAPKLDEIHGDVGELHVAEIGLPQRFLKSRLHWLTATDFAAVSSPRKRDSHKGNFGHVAALGGAKGKHGALNLSGMAALRMGAGYVTLISPDEDFRPVWPDLMQANWHSSLEGKSVIAAGPGLGTSNELSNYLSKLVDDDPRPMVLDADALNNLSPWRGRVRDGLLRVVTPHPGEMRRLLGREGNDRIADARELASSANLIVVLKGHRTVIAFPDGHAWINSTGSPALAKAGSGDVLAGMIAGMLAQFPTLPRESVLAAVYLHGRCGELAERAGHERTSIASELTNYLAESLHELT